MRVCAESDLWDGEMQGFDLAHGAVLLFRADGVYRAYQGMCPHQSVRLAEGELDGCHLTCRGHNWVFDLKTGEGVNPRRASLATYPVQMRTDGVYVGTTAERLGSDATGAPTAVA